MTTVTGTVTPDHGLANKQTVHVTADGFPSTDVNQPIHVIQCVHGATSSVDCEGATDDPTVNLRPDGTYDNARYTVYVLPSRGLPTASIKCDRSHPCDLYIGDDYNHLQTSNHVMVPIAFGPGPSDSSLPTGAIVTVLLLILCASVALIGLRTRKERRGR